MLTEEDNTGTKAKLTASRKTYRNHTRSNNTVIQRYFTLHFNVSRGCPTGHPLTFLKYPLKTFVRNNSEKKLPNVLLVLLFSQPG